METNGIKYCDTCLEEISDRQARVTVGGRHYHIAHYSPEQQEMDFFMRPGRPIPEFVMPPRADPPPD